jgi:predicted transposase/invertase (TIGR01784 family)
MNDSIYSEVPEAARTLYGNSFPLVDVTDIPDDEILRHKRVALLELVQKHIWQRDVAELLKPVGQLLRIASATAEQQEALLSYLLQAGNMADLGKFAERLIDLSPEHKEKMMTIAEYLKQIGREEGLEKGREEGREEGAAAERLSLARNLLKMNFPVEKIAEWAEEFKKYPRPELQAQVQD